MWGCVKGWPQPRRRRTERGDAPVRGSYSRAGGRTGARLAGAGSRPDRVTVAAPRDDDPPSPEPVPAGERRSPTRRRRLVPLYAVADVPKPWAAGTVCCLGRTIGGLQTQGALRAPVPGPCATRVVGRGDRAWRRRRRGGPGQAVLVGRERHRRRHVLRPGRGIDGDARHRPRRRQVGRGLATAADRRHRRARRNAEAGKPADLPARAAVRTWERLHQRGLRLHR